MSGPDFIDWREQSRSFEVLAYFTGAGETSVTRQQRVRLRHGGAGRRRATSTCSAPRRGSGRLFTRRGSDARRPAGRGDHRCLLAAAVRRRSRRDRHRRSRSTSATLTIVGVTAPAFRFPARADIYYRRSGPLATPSRTAHNYRARRPAGRGRVGRAGAVGDDRHRRAARAAVSASATATRACGRDAAAGRVVGDTRQTLFVLLGAVGVRAADRVRERRQPAAGARVGARPRDWSCARRSAPAACGWSGRC